MTDLKKAFAKSNLERAWRWINSNPSYQYKNYFRDSYSAYGISLDSNLTNLAKRLRDNVYIPCNSTLLLLPKNNISTRPYTLLTVEDQIVYQALVNIVAENFYEKFKKNYYILTHGNLYAGKGSTFFYRKWENGFKTFNSHVRKTFDDGYKYIATFDLTACYDSIDHNVLRYMLEKNGIEKEFAVFITNLLKTWSSNVEIYKGHGIPQGPISSGLLAEVLLCYFDERYKKLKNQEEIKYFRYVDDIKLLANDERTLMRMLVKLDFYSKQIGLFPQSSKIEIRKIKTIDNEILDLSDLGMEIEINKIIDKKKLEEQFKKTYNGSRVISKTKFKMYLSALSPNSLISNKLIRIIASDPQFFQNISNYFRRYSRKISDKVIDNILCELNRPEAFQVVSAALLDEIAFNLSELSTDKVITYCAQKWEDRKNLNPQLRYVTAKILLIKEQFKFKELQKYLESESDWWVKKSLLKYVSIEQYGEVSYTKILLNYLKSENIELCNAAVSEIIEKDLDIKFDASQIDYKAQEMLKCSGYIYRSSRRPSSIHECMKNITLSNVTKIDWKKIFGSNHRNAENKMIRARAYANTDISAFVNIFDTFNDMLLEKLHTKDTTIGKYMLGTIGGKVGNKGTKFEGKYPKTFEFCKLIHDLRLECDLSHPIVKTTKKYTKPIPYKTIFKIRPMLKAAILEMSTVW